MAAPERRVLFVLSRVLGGKTFSGHLLRALEGMPHIHGEFVFFDEDDYRRHRDKAPAAARATGRFLAAGIIRWKLSALGRRNWEAVFIQSFELLPGCRDLLGRHPAVLAHDSTQVQSYRLLLRQSPGARARLLYAAKCLLTMPLYAPLVDRVGAFMPRTQWCAQSLREDFGVPPSRILPAPAGLDLDLWCPGPRRDTDGLPRLLFVGNDFARKGGGFLLDLFARRLRGCAKLRIISRDRALEGKRLPAECEWIRDAGPGDIHRLVSLYRESDVFLFPTRKEHMGMVLAEAASVGLPIVASAVGGVGEIVRHGWNGFLLPYGAGEGEWASRILELAGDGEMRRRFGANGRALAENHLSQEVLRRRLDRALDIAAGTFDGTPRFGVKAGMVSM